MVVGVSYEEMSRRVGVQIKVQQFLQLSCLLGVISSTVLTQHAYAQNKEGEISTVDWLCSYFLVVFLTTLPIGCGYNQYLFLCGLKSSMRLVLCEARVCTLH